MLSREVLARAHRVGTDIDVRKMAIRATSASISVPSACSQSRISRTWVKN